MNVENAHGGEVEKALTWQHENDPDESIGFDVVQNALLGEVENALLGKIENALSGKVENTLSRINS